MRRNEIRLSLLALALAATATPALGTIYTVTQTGDSGGGSLRWAIGEANAHAGTDQVAFNLPGSGVRVISVLTPLPSLAAGTSVLGTTQPGYAGTPLVRIDGGNLAANIRGFDTAGGGLTIEGLQIVRFNGSGVRVYHDNVVIRRNYIGTSGAVAMGNQGDGIRGHAGAGLVIGGSTAGYGNVISGNAGAGVVLDNSCVFAVLWGNRIGTNATGSAAIPNGNGGLRLYTSGHLVGGSGSGMWNQISGNLYEGIVTGDDSTGIGIHGNLIGTNAAGSAALPNAWAGISLGGDGHLVGGSAPGAGNLISGNGSDGIVVREGADTNAIVGNRIGTNQAGSAAIANVYWGLKIFGSAADIGGDTAAEMNLVSGNGSGVYFGAEAHDNVLRGNRIGTNAAGTAALGNTNDGVRVDGDVNRIGGAAAGEGNLISGNGGDGVVISSGADTTVVQGNRIGTDPAGSAAIANVYWGLKIYGAAADVGGSAAASMNLISGNGSGVYFGMEAHDNVLRGNRIGTNAAGTAALGNTNDGVRVDGDDNRIGGPAAGEGNLISGNGGSGVTLYAAAGATVIQGNRIGTTADGNGDLGNGDDGIVLTGPGNLVGGDSDATRNVISGNEGAGIVIYGDDADGNMVIGNRIGTNAAGNSPLGNGSYGIRANDGEGTTIARNLISANGRAFSLEGETADGVVQGNIIGLNLAMNARLANGSTGLDVAGVGHRIGGTAAGEGNVIAGNQYSGVWIAGGATGNVLEGNFIGTNPAGDAGLGNDQLGIVITEASGNTIGGVDPGAGNTIAHNDYLGIYVWSGESNAILGNSIHDNGLLGIDLEPQGPVPNDAGDWDAGPNRGQNYPVVTSAMASGGDLEIEGFLAARPSTEYRVEFFSSAAFDPTGVGEGEHFLGAVDVTTAADGRGEFAATVAAAGGEQFVTATATSPELDTSEFSPAIAIGAPQPGQFQIWRDLLLSYEGTPGLAVSIVRSHGVAGTVSVDVATLEDSAISPDDFGAVDTELIFAPGEVVKTVFVPIVTDAAAEGDERWHLVLEAPTGGAVLGPNQNVLAWLFDATLDWPMYSIGDATVVEGDDGTRNVQITVTLSPTGHDVPIEWWTSDGTAVVGEDYAESTGTLLFTPGQTSKTITVEILGDAAVEPDESFYVHLYGQGQAIVWDGLADVRILDDDGGSDNFIFADGFEAGNAQAWSSILGNP